MAPQHVPRLVREPQQPHALLARGGVLVRGDRLELRQRREGALVLVGAQAAEQALAVAVLAGPVEGGGVAAHAAEPLGELALALSFGLVDDPFGDGRPPPGEEASDRLLLEVAGLQQW